MANKLLIVKNSAALYVRMLLSMLVSLYTSRVVLEALGAEDFGVYNVVGGLIGFMGFLNGSLSGATSRFISFELVNNDKEKLKDTFSSAFLVNLILAAVIIIFGETIGLWFLNHKLSIPQESVHAANWVYQFTIIGMVVSITQIPYTADVIAHEKMTIYAYIELVVVGLRLLMAYVLLVIDKNHLIWYAAMVTSINVLMALAYRFYCVHNFEESRIRFVWRPEILKPLLNFSGWNVFGNICLTVRVQGLTVLINMFFGVLINAAYGIANQVNNSILSFSTNIITAYRPQIIKEFACKSFHNFSSLIIDGAKFALIAMLCMVIPLSVEVDYVLGIWLKNPPAMTNILCQLALVASVIGTSNYTINIGIQATGKVKYLSITNGFLYLLILCGSYCALKLGCDVEWIFYVTMIVNILLFISSTAILKWLVPAFESTRMLIVIFKVVFITIMSCFVANILKNSFAPSFFRLVVVTAIADTVLLLLTYLILLSKHERHKLNDIVLKFIRGKKSL